jgi:alpha-beta hydrolase superfamily lysophospholipase
MFRATFRRYAKIAAAVLFAYLVASAAAGVFLAEITLHLPRRPVEDRAEYAARVRKHFQAELQDVSIATSDGIHLRGWYARPEEGNGTTVILLHGITDNRQGVAGYAEMFLSRGYSVLLPDSRAHGASGGDIATYGVKERYDVRDWVRWSQERTKGCVYLFGESMGAAISLQAAAVTPEVCAVVVESPFSHFREIAYDRIARHAGTGLWFPKTAMRPAIELALAYSRIRYGVDLTEAGPAEAMANSRVPALLIHGTADHNIPLRHSLILMKEGGSHAQLWQVSGAVHGNAVEVAPEEFQRRVLDWFVSHDRSAENPNTGTP